MTFTDDDLKRLKLTAGPLAVQGLGPIRLHPHLVEAPLARLEAAEAIATRLENTPEGGYAQDGYEKLLETWHKISGK